MSTRRGLLQEALAGAGVLASARALSAREIAESRESEQKRSHGTGGLRNVLIAPRHNASIDIPNGARDPRELKTTRQRTICVPYGLRKEARKLSSPLCTTTANRNITGGFFDRSVAQPPLLLQEFWPLQACLSCMSLFTEPRGWARSIPFLHRR